MNIIYTKRQQELICKIEEKLGKEYEIDYKLDGISIFINKAKCNLKLNIDITLAFTKSILVLYFNGQKQTMKIDCMNDCEYLDTLQDILNNLNNQFSIYYKYINSLKYYIKEEINSVDCFLFDDSGCLYFKGKNKVVIIPVFDMTNESDVVQLTISDIYSRHHINRTTLEKHYDILNDVLFFLYD